MGQSGVAIASEWRCAGRDVARSRDFCSELSQACADLCFCDMAPIAYCHALELCASSSS